MVSVTVQATRTSLTDKDDGSQWIMFWLREEQENRLKHVHTRVIEGQQSVTKKWRDRLHIVFLSHPRPFMFLVSLLLLAKQQWVKSCF